MATYIKKGWDEAARVEIGRNCAKICETEGFAGHKRQAELRVARYSREVPAG